MAAVVDRTLLLKIR